MSLSKTEYLLIHNEYEYRPNVRVSFTKVIVLVMCFPLLAFLFCIIYSVIFNFEKATYTHCQVFNFLPSISAAIGNFSPQREIWQTAMTLQLFPRILVAREYLNHHHKMLHSEHMWMGYMAFILNIVENISLITLSFFTSSRYYAVHEKAFVIFILVSVAHMFLMNFIQRKYKRPQKYSMIWKRRCFFTNFIFILLAAFFFARHNSLCEPYVYSLFAASEYMVVLSNIAFHFTAYLDFNQKDLVIFKHGFAVTDR
ncbi:post-GPI attachment to proteins factor 2-like [Anthonomus grandis grandis]|uniref:post-GPI attachment to proteins factor 2-like n=1 Tax=Anthonomus grandis grandis TaxID=2921223 RepID=UPI0021656F11|nr:post-GPI attachment to proteins factor 2-like [Anthonomus grandis grandis]